MKITKLTTFVVPPRWLFLKIETDAGVTGWGEPVVEGRAETVAACVAELADYLIGKDPAPIEDHWTVLYRGGFYRGGAIHMSALAGIDQALWDIKGKVLNQPVHALLGGPVRHKMRVYSWIGGDRPDDIVQGAKDVAAKGFTAIKMLATEELAFLDSHAKLDAVIARVAALRDAMGPDFGIAVDFHGRVHRPMAKQLAKELDPLSLDVHRGAGAQRTCRSAEGNRQSHRHPDCAGRAIILALGLQKDSQRRVGGYHSARSLSRRRHHRDAQDRGDGGSL